MSAKSSVAFPVGKPADAQPTPVQQRRCPLMLVSIHRLHGHCLNAHSASSSRLCAGGVASSPSTYDIVCWAARPVVASAAFISFV